MMPERLPNKVVTNLAPYIREYIPFKDRKTQEEILAIEANPFRIHKFEITYPFKDLRRYESVEFHKNVVKDKDTRMKLRSFAYNVGRRLGFKVVAVTLPNGNLCIQRIS